MESKRVDFHPDALAEANSAIRWYRERSSKAGEAFISELGEAIELISKSPHRWPYFDEDYRRSPLIRFPYWIIYFETPEKIRILAVAHGRRRPGYWRNRRLSIL
jgi:plasmid stabilization system protein ParE